MQRFCLAFLLIISGFAVKGQSVTKVASSGDTMLTASLEEVKITARWKNDTERYRYNQMKFYVTTVLPYVKATTQLFNDINIKLADPDLSRKEWRRYKALKEDEMRSQFEDKIKDLNITQGKLLVKLIARQTNLNLYKMINEVKNPLVAIKWQSWARVNGMNLDKRYKPDEEQMLELIMEDLGYPLPASYALAETGN
jgi:hypothetical protein